MKNLKLDKNLLLLFKDTSNFKLRNDEFRRINCERFWNYLHDNIALIEFAVDAFAKLPNEVFEELREENLDNYMTSRSIRKKEEILELPQIIQLHQSTAAAKLDYCSMSTIEEPYRRLAYLMYAIDTSRFTLINYPLLSLLPRVVYKKLTIEKTENGNLRYSVHIEGGLTKENIAVFENLNFERVVDGHMQREQVEQVSLSKNDSTYNGLYIQPDKPFKVSIIVTKESNEATYSIFERAGFEIIQV